MAMKKRIMNELVGGVGFEVKSGVAFLFLSIAVLVACLYAMNRYLGGIL